MDARIDLLGLPRPKLAAAVAGLIDRPFRVDQLFGAIHRRGVGSFAEMTDLGGSLRLTLAERFRIDGLPIATRSDSTDGTRKFLFRLPEGSTVETVDIPDRGRHTLCLSSQAGCALACRFCVTGYWGAGRNLTSGEIVAQVRALRWGDPPLPPQMNLVFMGMGEPLLNLGALRDAIEVLADDISPRRITVSTAGIVPGIEELGGWPRRPNLAVSLHAPDDARRTELMPVNASYPIAELLAALRAYPLERGRRITFEYILIRDYNDSLRDADALARLLRDLPSKINLIPANSDPVLDSRMVPPEEGAVERFQRRLMDRGYTTTVRRRRGDDVSAACGQLRATGREPRGFRGEVSW